jgi:hypothetical protein
MTNSHSGAGKHETPARPVRGGGGWWMQAVASQRSVNCCRSASVLFGTATDGSAECPEGYDYGFGEVELGLD